MFVDFSIILFVNEFDTLLDVGLKLFESRIDQFLLIVGDFSDSKRFLNSIFLFLIIG